MKEGMAVTSYIYISFCVELSLTVNRRNRNRLEKLMEYIALSFVERRKCEENGAN
jgi:hypothetical protein